MGEHPRPQWLSFRKVTSHAKPQTRAAQGTPSREAPESDTWHITCDLQRIQGKEKPRERKCDETQTHFPETPRTRAEQNVCSVER